MRQITKEEFCALDDEARAAALRPMRWTEAQAFAFGFCGNRNAPFPSILSDYLNVEANGRVTLSWAGIVGLHRFLLEEINRRLHSAISSRRAKDRAAALASLAAWVAPHHRKQEEVQLWWDAHVDAIAAQMELTRVRDAA